MRNDMSEDVVVSESQLRDIIERAARMSWQDGVSIAELRRIADELEIDPAALDHAISQVLAAEPVGTTHRGLKRIASALLELPSAAELRGKRRHAFVAFSVLAALMSPGDVVWLTLLYLLPMALLYELVVRVWAFVDPRDDDPPLMPGVDSALGSVEVAQQRRDIASIHDGVTPHPGNETPSVKRRGSAFAWYALLNRRQLTP